MKHGFVAPKKKEKKENKIKKDPKELSEKKLIGIASTIDRF